ncbi:hypothetical protein [Paenibacillus terrigena]|uniref:hypothetical protein n=1 Tax=Paenibacillus terrigena TaxID=369333 RepID=UPI0028D4ACFC|nr:hypothetical protein [Paenibacillus terrigena]
MDMKKRTIGLKAIEAGLIKDPEWLDRLDEPAPLWLILNIALQLKEDLDPPHKPFD